MRLSPILLLILLIVVTALSCKAQVTLTMDTTHVYSGLTTGNATTTYWTNYKAKVDTIKSYLLVSNEYFRKYDNNQDLFTMIGYEVIKHNGYLVEWFYLDSYKRPIPDKYIVWMSKPIRK